MENNTFFALKGQASLARGERSNANPWKRIHSFRPARANVNNYSALSGHWESALLISRGSASLHPWLTPLAPSGRWEKSRRQISTLLLILFLGIIIGCGKKESHSGGADASK